jgi:hypothetical protein
MQCQIGNSYSYNGLIRSIDIFNFPKDYTSSLITLSYRYLFQYGNRYSKSPSVQEIENSLSNFYIFILRSATPEKTILFELTDIMLEFSPRKGEEMLATIRYIDSNIPDQNINTGNIQRILNIPPININLKKNIDIIYNDSQNVHNSKLNESVKKCAINIHKIASSYGPLPDWENVKSHITTLFGPANKVFERINRDNATYGIDLNLKTLFLSVWVWINKHEAQDELLIRLWQEFLEMEGYCSTGFLSRLMNIIQGFTDDEGLQITISDSDQCRSVIKHYCDTLLKDNPDMMDEMMEKSDVFLIFMLQNVDKKIDEWEKEYGEEFITEMKLIINKYTDMVIFG